MKAKILVEKEVDIKTLSVEAGVRYWQDATVNGTEDTDGTLIPCRDGELWKPVIDIESGIITNWIKGNTASIHYVCDSGSYHLLDAEGNRVKSIENDYVPDIMCPVGGGYGDYIIMNVDSDGKIDRWHPIINDFFESEN
jgi:hypothetical protein